jgi:hypothetical protein
VSDNFLGPMTAIMCDRGDLLGIAKNRWLQGKACSSSKVRAILAMFGNLGNSAKNKERITLPAVSLPKVQYLPGSWSGNFPAIRARGRCKKIGALRQPEAVSRGLNESTDD